MRRALIHILIYSAVLVGPARASAAMPWLNSSWQHRVPITATPAQIEGLASFADFALLISLDGAPHADVFSGAKADGSDLLITSGDGTTVLEREIVSFDNVALKAEIWVRVPAFSKADNELFLYYANPDTTLDAAPTAAWSDEYRAVYHFNENPGDNVLGDSSPQGSSANLDPARGWTSSDVEEAQIGQGWFFNGNTHHINTTSISTQDSSYALSGWLSHTQVNSDFFIEANPGFWHLSSQVTPFSTADYADGAVNILWYPNPIAINDGYHHFLWAFDAVEDTVVFYYDGVPQPVWVAFPENVTPFYTGRLINPTNADPVGILGNMFYIDADLHIGGADEYRIREGVVGADRILTEYRSQKDNAAFLSFGVEENASPTAVGDGSEQTLLRFRSFPNPSRGTSLVSYSLATVGDVRLSVYDVTGREVATLVDRVMPPGSYSSRWDGRNREGQRMAAGVYFLRLRTPNGIQTTKITMLR